MKKLLSTAVLAAIVVGAASQASALTSANYLNSLQRVVYNPTQVELIADLGNMDTIATGTNMVNGGFGLADFNAGTTWADVDLAYFAYDYVVVQTGPMPWDTTATRDMWWASTNDNLILSDVNMYGTLSFGGAATGVIGQVAWNNTQYDTGLLGGTTLVDPIADRNAFTYQMGPDGSMSILTQDGKSQQNLALFDAAGSQSVDMYLYHMNKVGAAPWTLDGTATTNYTHVITTFEDGSTTLAAGGSPVPLPGALWLLGTGLMGIVGMRRKNS